MKWLLLLTLWSHGELIGVEQIGPFRTELVCRLAARELIADVEQRSADAELIGRCVRSDRAELPSLPRFER